MWQQGKMQVDFLFQIKEVDDENNWSYFKGRDVIKLPYRLWQLT